MALIDGMNEGFGVYQKAARQVVGVDPNPFIGAYAAKAGAYAQAKANDQELYSNVMQWKADIPEGIKDEIVGRWQRSINQKKSDFRNLVEKNNGDVAWTLQNDPKARSLIMDIKISPQEFARGKEQSDDIDRYEKVNEDYSDEFVFDENGRPLYQGNQVQTNKNYLENKRRLLGHTSDVKVYENVTNKNIEEANKEIMEYFTNLGDKKYSPETGFSSAQLRKDQFVDLRWRQAIKTNKDAAMAAMQLAKENISKDQEKAIKSKMLNEGGDRGARYLVYDEAGNASFDQEAFDADYQQELDRIVALNFNRVYGIEVDYREGMIRQPGGGQIKTPRITEMESIALSGEPSFAVVDGTVISNATKVTMNSDMIYSMFSVSPQKAALLGRINENGEIIAESDLSTIANGDKFYLFGDKKDNLELQENGFQVFRVDPNLTVADDPNQKGGKKTYGRFYAIANKDDINDDFKFKVITYGEDTMPLEEFLIKASKNPDAYFSDSQLEMINSKTRNLIEQNEGMDELSARKQVISQSRQKLNIEEKYVDKDSDEMTRFTLENSRMFGESELNKYGEVIDIDDYMILPVDVDLTQKTGQWSRSQAAETQKSQNSFYQGAGATKQDEQAVGSLMDDILLNNK